ncbi:MAG: M28 family metallopeptidase [Candidatus Rokubacteria bacterium]|nr:M28 family metallopeptidase [Candidatus Rokubacteria bacterium]
MLRAPWQYRDALETELLPEVSAARLMADVHALGAWERESGSPGEARGFDHIEAQLRAAGLAIDRREIEAYISLPKSARLILPDGSEIEALTHSFSTSTPGLDAELVDAGDGNPEDFRRIGTAAGKIVLVQSFATPGKAWASQEAGTAGQVFVNVDHLHNMIVTTIWGSPSPDNAWRIPRTPCLSIRRADADRLRGLLAAGPVRVRMVTRVETGWIPIPHLVASLEGAAEDRYLLFSGHVDAWHHGAMDNGSANATMLEVARLVARRRRAMRRGLRLAFWSGHSHGRYAGSAWYADHAWEDLHRRCILHLNVDSTGARGASDYSAFHATEEAHAFAEAVVADVTGQRGRARRFSRAGDQSFWGIGVPSAFMSLSGIPRQDTEFSRALERLFGGAGFPWWWHTREDTVDKIDPEVLVLDTRVYTAATLRLLNAPVLPFDHRRAARAFAAVVADLERASGGRARLDRAGGAAQSLIERTERLAAALEALGDLGPGTPAIESANRLLVRLSRALVPLGYTTGDRFTHDLAIGIPPLAGLERARDLARLDPDSDLYKFTAAALVREENRAAHALGEAAELIDAWLEGKENGR